MTIRVAMVSQRYLPFVGGAERQIERLAPLLAERGVEVTVLTRRLPGTPRRERLGSVDVVRVPVPRSKAAASVAYTAGAALELVRLRPDLIHVHGLLSPATAGLLAGAVLRVPVVAKLLASGPNGCLDRLSQKPFARLRRRALGSRFSALITLSDEGDRELLSAGVPREHLARIPNGVDASVFRPAGREERDSARRALGLPSGPLALYCGRLEPPKRVHELVEAFRAIDGATLVIVGTGSEEAAIRRRASDPALANRVVVRGPVEDTAPFYRAVDLYVSASEREGMSGSALEAMASGLPVIARPAPGMPELLGDGAGVLAPPAGDRALPAAVRDLLRDPATRERIGDAAHARVRDRYSLATTADRLVGLYSRLLQDPGGLP